MAPTLIGVPRTTTPLLKQKRYPLHAGCTRASQTRTRLLTSLSFIHLLHFLLMRPSKCACITFLSRDISPEKQGDYREHATHYLMVGSVSNHSLLKINEPVTAKH